MKSVKVTISQGKINVAVQGIKGASCTDVTTALAKTLGANVAHRVFTDEFYESDAPATTNEQQNQLAQ